jgi:hypothetical protein
MDERWLLKRIKQRKMKYLLHIKRHDGLEKRIMEGYIGLSGKGRRADQKGDGFRILETIYKLLHGMQDILHMIEWSSEGLSREQSSNSF